MRPVIYIRSRFSISSLSLLGALVFGIEMKLLMVVVPLI